MALSNQQVVAFLRKYPVGIACAVLCLGLGAYYVFFVWDDIPAARTLLEDKKAQAERLTANITNASQLREQSEIVAKAFVEIESRLVQASELDTNLKFFWKIEADTGVKIIELRQSAPLMPQKDKKPAFSAVPYTVGVQGDYNQLVAFLRYAENGKHYCRINAATIQAPTATSAGSGEEGARVDSHITLTLSLDLLGHPTSP